MYLFDKKGNSVFVYGMHLDEIETEKYRRQEIEKNNDIKCFKFETSKVDKKLNLILGHRTN